MTTKQQEDLAGRWFVWISPSATTGSPNIKNGRISRYGTYISLPSRAEAKKFEADYDDYFDHNDNCQVYACTVNTGRLFAFGLSSTEFMIDLVMAPEVENFSDYKKGY